MEKHITEGQLTIDIREYRELIEAAAEADYYRREYFRVNAELMKLKGEAYG